MLGFDKGKLRIYTFDKDALSISTLNSIWWIKIENFVKEHHKILNRI